jgi:signal transduction histidine kinase
MYSLFPALVSALFLGYGLYVVAEKGFNRISSSFLVLCLSTFFWQATWAVLFQVRDPVLADILVRFGYLLIAFLPTSLYHFLSEISGYPGERRYVLASYALAAVLGGLALGSNLVVAGHYDYFFGYYPKAGLLHPLHVAQTVVVVSRGLYITWRQQQVASADQRVRLRLCIASLFIYFFAAIDYLCNYGFEFYPPGVAFLVISLGIIVRAVVKYELMSPVAVAASVAHEMRTPLASIRLQAAAIEEYWPLLHQGYEQAVRHGLVEARIDPATVQRLTRLSQGITQQVDRSNVVIDVMLASARMESIDASSFGEHAVLPCIHDALERYPFSAGDRERTRLGQLEDFRFHGSDALLVFVLFNLLKNALYALKAAGRGEITISSTRRPGANCLSVTDTGTGVGAEVLPRIFDTFYTTKKAAGAGLGLAFCKRVMTAFGGTIRCESVETQYTTFILEFPPIAR